MCHDLPVLLQQLMSVKTHQFLSSCSVRKHDAWYGNEAVHSTSKLLWCLLAQLGCKGGRYMLLKMDTDTCPLLPQAISNVKKAKAVEWVCKCVHVSVSDIEASALANCLTQALPLIKHVTELQIDSVDGGLNETAMQAICQFVLGRKDELKVVFYSTKWVVGDMMTLVAHMPHNSIISFEYKNPEVEQHIILLCCAARRKFSLTACRDATVLRHNNDKQPFCEQRIRSALQAGGMEVLNLKIVDNYILDITVQPHHYNLS
jgi:hypothetical protein